MTSISHLMLISNNFFCSVQTILNFLAFKSMIGKYTSQNFKKIIAKNVYVFNVSLTRNEVHFFQCLFFIVTNIKTM